MNLPDYPIDNKLEKISVYKDSYIFLILIVLVFTFFDFIIFSGFNHLHFINLAKLILLIVLHPFFKRRSSTNKEEEQIRIFIASAFAFPINIFFTFAAFDSIVNIDHLFIKQTYYYTFQFSLYLIFGVSCLRFDLNKSFLINGSFLVFYYTLFVYLQKLYSNSEMDTILLFQMVVLLFCAVFPLGINFYLDKFHRNQKRFEEQTYFWKNYSENLLKKNPDKTFYFQNICLLYFDITGIANYFRAKNTLLDLDQFLKMLFVDIDEFCKQNKIELHKEDGRYWFLVNEHPANTNPEYADALADLALFMQSRFKRICAENHLQFELRMGMSSWKYIDYTTNAQKIDIFYVNKAFKDAADMEKFGINGEIQVTEETFQLLKTRFMFIKRGNIILNSEKESNFYLLSSRA